ncbi:10064_t:CDS:2 [Diversispora eburnea]|uniref:10064_t:CDS:1 n=1 Tax=Diversispora eburnea TaxID=1213867 RepID=A0A9N9G2B4_9GLOM|nr:10064_t:CDS:2 [Diversispora eburnea]
MSLPYSKKDSFEIALKGRFIKIFDYNTFENIAKIEKGGFGTVYRANTTNLKKDVALKSLHENINDELFYEKFVRELTNITAVNYHDNIINFYGISKNLSTETYYLVFQYAKDGNLRTYLRNIFVSLDWTIKIKMAKDIASGLHCIHEENIIHKDLTTSTYIKVHGKMIQIKGQRPPIKTILDSLENIKLENIYNEINDNQDIQLEAHIDNSSTNVYSKDSVSIPSSFTTSNSDPNQRPNIGKVVQISD